MGEKIKDKGHDGDLWNLWKQCGHGTWRVKGRGAPGRPQGACVWSAVNIGIWDHVIVSPEFNILYK